MVYPWGRIFESQYLGQTNFGLIDDEKIDELFAQINVTLDDETQKELIHELINYITENVIYLPLTYSANFVAYHPDLEVTVHPMSVNPYYVRWTK
jgi:ABC-type transport system substrate-binding protein